MNGCPKSWRLRKSCLGMFLLSLFLLPPVIASAEETAAPDQPSLEMLDFLGLFNDEESGWVDPFELPESDAADLPPEQEQEQEDGDEQ